MSKPKKIKHVPGAHSPGPWKAVVDDGSREDGADEILDARGIVIARVEGDDEFREIYNGGEIEGPGCTAHSDALDEEDANARLISAAPDLLAIAKEANQFIDELCMALARRGIFIETLLPESRMGFGSRLLMVIVKAEAKP